MLALEHAAARRPDKSRARPNRLDSTRLALLATAAALSKTDFSRSPLHSCQSMCFLFVSRTGREPPTADLFAFRSAVRQYRARKRREASPNEIREALLSVLCRRPPTADRRRFCSQPQLISIRCRQSQVGPKLSLSGSYAVFVRIQLRECPRGCRCRCRCRSRTLVFGAKIRTGGRICSQIANGGPKLAVDWTGAGPGGRFRCGQRIHRQQKKCRSQYSRRPGLHSCRSTVLFLRWQGLTSPEWSSHLITTPDHSPNQMAMQCCQVLRESACQTILRCRLQP